MLDQGQQETVLRAIAISSFNLYPAELANAFKVLEDFKGYEGRMQQCIAWLPLERHHFMEHDITTPAKLYILEIVHDFLKKGYKECSDAERLMLRQAVLNSARQQAPAPVQETKILGKKLATLLAGFVVRDFPQRWTSFTQDVLTPMRQGGLWYDEAGAPAVNQIGTRICLECLKLVAEDCTDSDYNAKIPTKRRNDILIGLNEVSPQFLPPFFALLEHIAFLGQTKATLHNMRTYLLSENRLLSSMTAEESQMYQTQLNQYTQCGLLVADTLVAMEKFCRSMPLEWVVGTKDDFVTAFLHLLREPQANIQVLAVECLEQLCLRGKMTFHQWIKIVEDLPLAVVEANNQYQTEFMEQIAAERAVQGQPPMPPTEALTRQLAFHRALSRLFACVLSSYISHINSKQILSGSGKHYEVLCNFLKLAVDMLRHPSGRIVSEQVNTWITLLRDPQIAKANLLRPFSEDILNSYIDKTVRIRWEDVEQQIHPQSLLLEASWDDEDEYDAWSCDFRSKVSILFKFFGNTDPQTSARVINARVQSVLSAHANGEPLDHLHPGNNQLTQISDAVLFFEGLFQPLDSLLGGLPQWSLDMDERPGKGIPKRTQIRTNTRASLAELAAALVSWNPSYLWLKFRRAALLDALRHYWKYDPSTLLQGIDSLLRYLGDPDDWNVGISSNGHSGQMVGLKKKSGVALVSVSKKVPHHLVPWLSQLSEATRGLLSSPSLLSMNQMHLYEFLSVIATAVDDPAARSRFIEEVLSDAVVTLESPEIQEKISSVPSFLRSLGVTDAAQYPASVTDGANVQRVTGVYLKLFTAVNQLLSVGKRCNEASRGKRSNAEQAMMLSMGVDGQRTFPDEGPVSLKDLAAHDPFPPLWPRFMASFIKLMNVTLSSWHPEHQSVMLRDRLQQYFLAISDDEAYLSKNHDSKSGGVFGEGGTAGSVVPGASRRDTNLVPKWSGWMNELRNTCFQLVGLAARARILYAPEISDQYPHLLQAVVGPANLKSMEHRHMTQYLKHFIEVLMISCPSSMYATHLGPVVAPVLEHMQYRLEKTWEPIIGATSTNGGHPLTKALTSSDCPTAAALAANGDDQWYSSYYARAGLFVGELDNVLAEATVEKSRVELSRTYSDMLQAALALKGDWALVLATQAKEEQASRRNDSSKLNVGPRNVPPSGLKINADGSPRDAYQLVSDARKSLRISALCHYLLLEDERIAGSLTVTIIQCLSYPDAYTCRRVTRICHRILETVAWAPQYTNLLGERMFSVAVKNIVREPKWMVGMEWEMINVLRDIYCRLVLGQTLQPGGQGAGMPHPKAAHNPNEFDQAKSVHNPLQGGGILTTPSNLPRRVLCSLPGIDMNDVSTLEAKMTQKRAAKDQKDTIRDLLRVAADNLKAVDNNGAKNGGTAAAGVFDRAVKEESLLHNPKRQVTVVPDLPEKLITHSMVQKKMAKRSKNKNSEAGPQGLAAFQL